MDKRPLILITNDDGLGARGLEHLVRIAVRLGDVVVVAPDTPQSGKSSAITVNTPLYVNEHAPIDSAKVFTTSGTPVDCVKLAMFAVLDRKPDLLLSGINHGSNSGVNNIYSGTMGATMEGCTLGIPSIGYSLLSHSPNADFDPTTPFIEEITQKVINHGLPDGICLNVNFPAKCTPLGLKVVRAAKSHWTEEYQEYLDPHGKPFFWLTGRIVNEEIGNPDTDLYWLDHNFATIVPARADQNATDAIPVIQKSLL